MYFKISQNDINGKIIIVSVRNINELISHPPRIFALVLIQDEIRTKLPYVTGRSNHSFC